MTARSGMPVLEVGGTHVSAALVETGSWDVVPGSLTRMPLSAQDTADGLIRTFVRAADVLGAGSSTEWAVAIPGPFDYTRGIGRYEHVGKFEQLLGVNLRDELAGRIRPAPAYIHFLNDADAFGIGEYAVGAARSHDRAVCITLGTGVGSAFLEQGEPVKAGPLVPPEGSAHRLTYRGRPLEETVSRRAIRAAYTEAAGTAAGAAVDGTAVDVHTIAERSRSGDEAAARVLHGAFEHLGTALGPVIDRFGADILVIGGSMARSWDIVAASVRRGLTRSVPSLSGLVIRPAERPDDAAISGAAYWAARHVKYGRAGNG